MNLTVSATIIKGKTAFVATCPELGVVSQGKSEKTALANLKEAVELYLGDGDVQEMLKNNPIHKAKIATIAVRA